MAARSSSLTPGPPPTDWMVISSSGWVGVATLSQRNSPMLTSLVTVKPSTSR